MNDDEEAPLGFFVPGVPAPGGSKSAFVAMRRDGSIVMRPGTKIPVVNVTDSAGKGNKEWRAAVAWNGRKFMMRTPPFPCAMRVEFIFFLRRPNDHFTAGNRERGILRPDAPPYHIQKPDALKFARSTEDALTGIVWRDDAQTVHISAEKRWADNGQQTGCIIKLFPLAIAKGPEVGTLL